MIEAEEGVAVAPEEGSEPGVPGEELEVLRLIVAGHTDHAIARRLGISVITVRRRVVRFRQRVGAATRIEAAVIAAKRGWL